MDEQTRLDAYINALLPERERFLYEKALTRSSGALKNLGAKEREEYLRGRVFQNTVYQLQRRDKVYQGLLRGELDSEQFAAEYKRLAPLIAIELGNGETVDLAFLRSVQRNRASLKKAHAALEQLREGAHRKFFKENTHRFVIDTEKRLERFLREEDLRQDIHTERNIEEVVPYLLDTLFKKGVPAALVERAWMPQSLSGALRQAVEQACPQLRACAPVITPSGETVSQLLHKEVHAAKNAVCEKVKQHFTAARLSALLEVNPYIAELQSEADERAARERGLRTALLDAIPEHYRDLYPLARQIRRRFILHLGPTNSGKTYDGVNRLHGARQGIYLGPLRLLAAEQFDSLNLNNVPCSLVTGEEQILVPNSHVQSSTVEMADLKTHYDVAVIDECQMIADRERGGAWTAAILGLCADEIHACASPDAEQLLTRIITECGDDLVIVRHERMTPLVVEKEGFQFPQSVRRGDALIVFSKARVHAVAAELKRSGYKVSLIYGALPPDVRRDQALRFSNGENEVVVSTDAIAMGMNLPIERVVFLEGEKYDGDITRPLTDSEIKQIAGRAGRYGIYDIGYVNAFGFKGAVAQALSKPLYPLTEAVIRFPESLLGIPLPLTQIINQWLAMKDKSCFSKASTVRMASLAEMMETKNTDRELLYRFLCIPFDETDQDLLARWKTMYHAECKGEHVEVLKEIPQLMDPDACTVAMLDGLEADYRRCDLYYNYARLFLEEPMEVLDEIQSRKSQISKGIIHILSTQRLLQKTCRACNRTLPWNWPYRVCDNCYSRLRGRR